MSSGPIQLAWEKVNRPESIFDLHHALQEALCYHHALRVELSIPDHRLNVCFDQRTYAIALEVWHTLTAKTFTAKVPYPFHDVSVAEFMEELKFATALWAKASPADQERMFNNSFAGKNLDHLQAALLSKGFDCRRTKPVRLVMLS